MTGLLHALKLPFTHLGRLSIGALLSMVPGLNLITGLFATGYVLDIMAHPRVEELPPWKHLWNLFVHGLLGVVVSIIWFLPALVVALIVFGRTLFTTGALQSELGSIATILVLVLFAIISYFVPAAILAYARTYRIRSALQFRTLLRTAWSRSYLIQWVLAVIVYLVANVISSVIAIALNFIGTIGAVLGIIIAGYISFTSATIAFALLGMSGQGASTATASRHTTNRGNAKGAGNRPAARKTPLSKRKAPTRKTARR